jgi:hypothetical protein
MVRLSKIEEEHLLELLKLVFNARLHYEDLSHQMFYVLTALIVGSWAVSSRVLVLPFDKALLNGFSSFLALAGLFSVYRLQNANDTQAVIVNLIRNRLHIDEATVKIDSCDKPIIPDGWKKYKLERITDCHLIHREGLRGGGGKLSQWAMYKWIYLVMLIVGVVNTILSIYLTC